jgi:hypothetical protein
MKSPAPLIFSFLLLPGVLQKSPATRSPAKRARLEASGDAPAIYDPDPKHIWNRLYEDLSYG